MVTGLYIHIPFCKNICNYCDFPKRIAKQNKIQKYINALCNEIIYNKKYYSNVETIYIGGGTPSSLSINMLEQLFNTLLQCVNFEQVIEFSFECNPQDITEELVDFLYNKKITRISMGVQTFQKKYLNLLNRKHTNDDVYRALHYVKKYSFNINIDMIFSIPTQTIEDVQLDLDKLSTLDVDHISYYSLILEKNTVFEKWINTRKISLNSEDLEADMYLTINKYLKQIGFERYEVSNFAKNKNYSIHNVNYWLNKDYLGLGMGAHSLIEDMRFNNTLYLDNYIQMIEEKRSAISEKNKTNKLEDTMIMGLRLTKGVNIKEVEAMFDIDFFHTYPKVKRYISLGLLSYQNNYLSFTTKGTLLANEVLCLFV